MTNSTRIRPAEPTDVTTLHDVRHRSIIALARSTMTVAETERWAAGMSLDGMAQKLRDLEIWVADVAGEIACWAAISGNRLEGLYTAPEFASRGVGAQVLAHVESLMRSRGIANIHADASSNALDFYLRRGYVRFDAALPNGALPISKSLAV